MDMKQYLLMLEIRAGVGAIMMTIKNPNSDNAKLLKSSLLELADSIYTAYGIVPPPRTEE